MNIGPQAGISREVPKAPPLIACCLSPLPGFESQPGHVGKLPVTWGQAVVFAGYSGFLHYLQLASHELAIIGINVTKNKIPKSLQGVWSVSHCSLYFHQSRVHAISYDDWWDLQLKTPWLWEADYGMGTTASLAILFQEPNTDCNTGELGYDGPLYDGFLHMTDDMLGPSPMHIKYSSYV